MEKNKDNKNKEKKDKDDKDKDKKDKAVQMWGNKIPLSPGPGT